MLRSAQRACLQLELRSQRQDREAAQRVLECSRELQAALDASAALEADLEAQRIVAGEGLGSERHEAAAKQERLRAALAAERDRLRDLARSKAQAQEERRSLAASTARESKLLEVRLRTALEVVRQS
jgi:hypothetical protein